MPHSNITPIARERAKTLRREMTKAERAMWDLLREFLPLGARFRRETPVGPYICDFAWLSARLIVEVDGDSHETAEGKRHDKTRDRFMEEQGFRVLRFDNDLVIASPDFVKNIVEGALTGTSRKPQPAASRRSSLQGGGDAVAPRHGRPK